MHLTRRGVTRASHLAIVCVSEVQAPEQDLFSDTRALSASLATEYTLPYDRVFAIRAFHFAQAALYGTLRLMLRSMCVKRAALMKSRFTVQYPARGQVVRHSVGSTVTAGIRPLPVCPLPRAGWRVRVLGEVEGRCGEG